jgi:GNAT superfamily N-acetyltransferase
MDVRNQKHVTCVLKLCKRNKQFHNAVYRHLQLAVPPLVQVQFPSSSDEYQFHLGAVEAAKSIRRVYDTRGVLAMVGTKVVGFLLYHLQIEDEYPDAQLLYMLVDRDYRRQAHGSRMLQLVIGSHMMTSDGLTLQNIQDNKRDAIANKNVAQIALHRTAKEQRRQTGRELVYWISCGIQRGESSCDENLAFYVKNGFRDVASWHAWKTLGVTSDTENLLVVCTAGFRATMSIHDYGASMMEPL